MRIRIERSKRLIFAAGALLGLLIAISGCSGFPLARPSETATSTSSPVPSFTPSPSHTPTFTFTPTAPGLASATVKPTLRPSWTPIPTNTLRPTWTASPTLSPTATQPVALLLEEDFDDPLNPWLDEKGKNWAVGNAGKKYFMSVYAPKVEITSARTWLKLAEVRIEADITHENGSGYYGFNCRETPAGTYYTIFVTTDGYYGFGENRNDKLTVLESHKLPELKPPIDPKGTNRVRADCRGNTLTLFINQIPIDSTYVPGLSVGYVGMMIGTRLEDERLTVYFDNLAIYTTPEDQ